MGEPKGIEIRKADIGPVQCYWEGKAFLGDRYGLFLLICLVGVILAGLIPLVLFGPAYCGIALCFLKRARGERVDFEHLFKGFDFFLPGLIATLIYVAAATIILIPCMLLMFALIIACSGSQEPVVMVISGVIMFLVYFGLIMILGIALLWFMFGVFLIVDKNLEGPAAMKYAAEGVWKNFWGVAGAAIVGQLMVFIGTLMCIAPGILVLPIVYAGHFIAYQKIFGVQKAIPVMAEVVRPNPF